MWGKPSKRLFDYVRASPFTHLPSGLDYWACKDGEDLYVAFAESNSRFADDNDWKDNLDFFPETIDAYTGVKAHRGIFQQYLSIREVLMSHLYGGSVKRIHVAGFSLGAALATFAVEDFGYHIDRDKLDVSVLGIAFDGPRVFAPSKIVKQAVKNRLVTIKAHWDPVVHVPCKFMFMPFKFSTKPFRAGLVKPALWVSRWIDCGKVIWIGKPWRVLPIQHYPAQIGKALLEKFGA